MPKFSKNSCYAGKILRVNLSNGEIKTESTYKYVNDWLGSAGIAIKILFDELEPGLNPYDPANIIVFGTGVLQGTTAPGACKMTISTLSPMTGGWGTSASDSYLGGHLKRAGYDLLIVSGKAHTPVYLYIEDETIEIRKAENLWGQTTWDTVDILHNDLNDPSLNVICIGPAGENLVRGACVIQDKVRAFGRCGTGAVMGSKLLKAVIAKGSGAISIAQPERFLDIVKKSRTRILNTENTKTFQKYGTYGAYELKQENCQMNYKNFQELILPDKLFKVLDTRKIIDRYKIGRSCFPSCPIGCGQVLHLKDGKFRGLKTEKSQWEAFSTLQTRLAVEDPQFVIKANALANQLGIDVDMVGGTIGWAIECFEKGIISKKDTGGMKLMWGDVDQIIKLIKMISYREGFGDLLAEGCTRASEVIGRNSKYYCMQIKKQELYEPCRGAMAWALGTVVSTRGGGHTTGVPQFETINNLDPKRMSKLYGIDPEDVNPLEYKGKPEIVFFTEILQRVANCLGICHFNTIWFDLDYIGLEDMAELYSSAAGLEISPDEFKTITLRQLNLEKVFNIRHAKFGRKDDLPTARDLSEPIPAGRLAGWKIDYDKWNAMLDNYYELHGWDKKTSYPEKETLDKLGIGYAYKDIINNI